MSIPRTYDEILTFIKSKNINEDDLLLVFKQKKKIDEYFKLAEHLNSSNDFWSFHGNNDVFWAAGGGLCTLPEKYKYENYDVILCRKFDTRMTVECGLEFKKRELNKDYHLEFTVFKNHQKEHENEKYFFAPSYGPGIHWGPYFSSKCPTLILFDDYIVEFKKKNIRLMCDWCNVGFCGPHYIDSHFKTQTHKKNALKIEKILLKNTPLNQDVCRIIMEYV